MATPLAKSSTRVRKVSGAEKRLNPRPFVRAPSKVSQKEFSELPLVSVEEYFELLSLQAPSM